MRSRKWRDRLLWGPLRSRWTWKTRAGPDFSTRLFYSKGRRPFPPPEERFACLPKKIPAARNTAEMAALVSPRRSLPWYIASAAFRNQTAAPRYQIQLKLRLTFLWDAPSATPASLCISY